MISPLEEMLSSSSTIAPEQRERIEIAHRNSLRLLKLVNTLLDFSRIEAGRIQASYEPTDLCKLTSDLASVFRSVIEGAGIRFTLDCEFLDEPVYVDSEMWEKIVFNLLSNAFKFTFVGEIAVSLTRSKAEWNSPFAIPEPASRPRMYLTFSSAFIASRAPTAAPSRAAASALLLFRNS